MTPRAHPDLKRRVDDFEVDEKRVGEALGVEQSRVRAAGRRAFHHRVDIADNQGTRERERQLARIEAIEACLQQRVVHFFDRLPQQIPGLLGSFLAP